MVKKDPFKDKPKPPSREQVIADLASASSNDVVFQFVQQNDTGHSDIRTRQMSKEDVSGHPNSSHKPITEHTESTTPDKVKINETYKQVERLIELQTQLNSEPKQLHEKYEQLEKLGQEVSNSILELKTAAESVVKKNPE